MFHSTVTGNPSNLRITCDNLCYRYAALYQNQHNKASEDIQKYISNPINAYLLVKRLTIDWKEVESLVNIDLNKGKYDILVLVLFSFLSTYSMYISCNMMFVYFSILRKRSNILSKIFLR